MNPNKNSPEKADVFAEEIEDGNTLSIDEFFAQLEEREKDLHITSSDTIIEIDEDDAKENSVQEFFEQEIFSPHSSVSDEAKKPPSTAGFPVERAAKAPGNLENQISSLQNQIARLESERVEIYELTRRRQTDFDTFKNRTERERSETFRSQLSNLATQILPVLDNLNRALDSASSYGKSATDSGSPQNFQQFFEGIMLVNQQLSEVLGEMGVQPIAAVGETFDPHFHEAVATEEATMDSPPHTITAELLRGYRIDDRVIRPSMVKVSK